MRCTIGLGAVAMMGLLANAIAAIDPKFHPDANGRWPVWVAEHEDIARVERDLRGAIKADFEKIELRCLPHDMQVQAHGLLYLPKPYVVPGGRFNEMYGWDGYFIELGLLRDGEVTLAKDMVDSFLYEIREYGKILNANRTYYVTRSQPPFSPSTPALKTVTGWKGPCRPSRNTMVIGQRSPT